MPSQNVSRNGTLRYHVYLFLDDVPHYDSIKYDYNCNLRIAGFGNWNRFHEISQTAIEKEAFLKASTVKYIEQIYFWEKR